MRFDLAGLHWNTVPGVMRVFKLLLERKWCIFFTALSQNMEPNRYEDNRKAMRGERRKEKEERDRWCNRWYILPGGSQGRGEGGSAIRQHTQEGGGQNISSVSKLGQRENESEEKRDKSVYS